MDVVEEKVRKVVIDELLLTELEVSRLECTTHFRNDLSADETSMYEVITMVEIEFDISIMDDERFSIRTFEELVGLVKRKIKERKR